VSVGTVVKFNVVAEQIPWYKTFAAGAGSSVSGVDGDSSGNMYVAATTCEPCTNPATCAPELYYGRPTGNLAPTCTDFLTKLAVADGYAVLHSLAS
jgi:hypothetical protein